MKKFFAAALVGTGISAASGVFAADGTITITGQIMDASCVINVNGGTGDTSVVLPSVSKDALASDGATAGASNISMSLSGCPAAGNVRAWFSPQNVDANTGNLLNTASGTPADNVQVSILNNTGDPIDLRTNSNNPLMAFVDDGSGVTGTATLNYSAQYIAVGGPATSGQVETQLVYTLDYQ